MDALIQVSSSEFNEDLFKKIKSLIKSVGNGEITIKVNNSGKSLFRHESHDEYWDRIKISGDEIKKGGGVVFTMEELDEYVHKMPVG